MTAGTDQPASSPSAASIHLDNFCLSIGREPLFQNLDFRFPAGQWSSLLGVSGAGKSLLLRSILGLTNGLAHSGISTSGTITTRSDCPRGAADSTDSTDSNGTAGAATTTACAYMAQQDLLLPWLGVRDNVMLGTRLRGEGKPAKEKIARADELLDAVNLLDHAEALPRTLSGGMRQRAALARTLWEDRPVVLMDEPFSALDAISRLHAQDLAARLLKGRTVVMVTHDPLEAIRLSDRICILRNRPARLSAAIVQTGPTPRDVTGSGVPRLHAQLLSQLADNRYD